MLFLLKQQSFGISDFADQKKKKKKDSGDPISTLFTWYRK